MNILVTGGSGWIGRYVVQDLLQHGHDVLSIDMTPPLSGKNREQASLTRYKTDIRHWPGPWRHTWPDRRI